MGSYEVQLDGPLRELRAGLRGRLLAGAGVDGGHRLFSPGLAHVLAGGLDVVLRALPFGDGEGAGRADVEAHAHAVAEDLPHQDGLVFVIEFQGSLVACRRAQTAAVAEVAIDLDDLPGAHLRSCSRDVPGVWWGTGVRMAHCPRDYRPEAAV